MGELSPSDSAENAMKLRVKSRFFSRSEPMVQANVAFSLYRWAALMPRDFSPIRGLIVLPVPAWLERPCFSRIWKPSSSS